MSKPKLPYRWSTERKLAIIRLAFIIGFFLVMALINQL